MLAIVIIAILLILIVVAIVLTIWTQNTNDLNRASQSLIPFSGYLATSGQFTSTKQQAIGVGNDPEDGLYLANTDGDPQIQCPVGTSINIVGAFLDVVDPYGECTDSPSPTLLSTCGLQPSSQTCTVDSDCPTGTACKNGFCTPSICTGKSNACGSADIPVCDSSLGQSCKVGSCGPGMACIGGFCTVDPGKGGCMACVDVESGDPIDPGSDSPGVCAYMPVCSNTTNGQNSTCAGTGDAGCRPRDASAYLAGHCDGKQSCIDGSDDKWVPGTPGGPFGPLPCQISAESQDPTYVDLPIAMGWGGGSPTGSDGTKSAANFNQGYYVHGIYTCTPN